MLENQEQHDMLLDKSYPSGAEEWYCPACGRRFVMQWPPKYKRIILNQGDAYAVHCGGKGGLKMGVVQSQPGEAITQNGEEDLHLEQWESWLDSIEPSSWWRDDEL